MSCWPGTKLATLDNGRLVTLCGGAPAAAAITFSQDLRFGVRPGAGSSSRRGAQHLCAAVSDWHAASLSHFLLLLPCFSRADATQMYESSHSALTCLELLPGSDMHRPAQSLHRPVCYMVSLHRHSSRDPTSIKLL